MSKRWSILAIAVGLTACGDNATAPTRADTELSFLRLRIGVPELASPEVSFWATYDEERRARIVYGALPGSTDSVTLVDFTVPSQSLSQRPDGSRLGPGDSIRVTISVIDPVRMIVRFEPSGLKFSSSRPARLRLALGLADLDLQGVDSALGAQLHIWRQERAGDPWVQMPSTVDVERGDVTADINGFTNYAVAY
jgi:hypothetical protein